MRYGLDWNDMIRYRRKEESGGIYWLIDLLEMEAMVLTHLGFGFGRAYVA